MIQEKSLLMIFAFWLSKPRRGDNWFYWMHRLRDEVSNNWFYLFIHGAIGDEQNARRHNHQENAETAMNDKIKEIPMVYMWGFKTVEELSRDELIEALKYSIKEIDSLRKEQKKLHQSVDWGKYLLIGVG